MNTKTINQNNKIEFPKVSARIVSKYLLSLDPERKYFTDSHLLITDRISNRTSRLTTGNFRLNKMLQIIQALYYACYKQPLFNDEIVAFEHGGVVFNIYRSFLRLRSEKEKIPYSYYLTTKQQEFVNKIFSYSRDHYSDIQLRDLSHEDLAWQKAIRRKGKGFVYNAEVLEYYKVLSSSMLKAMGLIGEKDC